MLSLDDYHLPGRNAKRWAKLSVLVKRNKVKRRYGTMARERAVRHRMSHTGIQDPSTTR
jgi:hypothetical protein